MKFPALIAPCSFGLLVSLSAVGCTGDVLGYDPAPDAAGPIVDIDAGPVVPPADQPDAALQPPPPPPPAPAILFVVGPAQLGPADSAAESRMESLGFVVEVRTAVLVKPTDADGRQLVVISSSVQSSDLGARLRDLSVPVLLWEPALFDDMLMTGATQDTDFGTRDNQLALEIKKPSHPIASGAGLGAGTVTVVSSKDRFSWARPLPSADVIATTASSAVCGCGEPHAAIFAYDKGDALAGGALAQARRVGLFLNDDTALRLDATGWKLFDAAIRWCAGVSTCVATTWYADVDADGFGDASTAVSSCTRPTTGGIDWVPVAGDCNDIQDSIHPGAPERCDGVDQDCDGVIDDQPVDGLEYYTDADGDGFGSPINPVHVCSTTPPPHTVLNDDDCNDASAAIRPGVPEIPGNSVDENCDGVVAP